jgi:hypothetical protein
VTIHVPGDYPTIQEGINAANAGDLVLVADGTYYENINYKGKAITVASHFLVDGDTSHISNTVIDGSQPSHPDSSSVVYFVSGEDTASILYGLTITGGRGTIVNMLSIMTKLGGGVFAINSGATIKNNIIELNILEPEGDILIKGGGIGAISEYESNFIIDDNVIRNNAITTVSTSWVGIGGGIDVWTKGKVWIRNNKVCENTVTGVYAYGGGLHFNDDGTGIAEFYIESNLFSGNIVNGSSNGGSGAIDIYHIAPVLRNNLMVNNSALRGGAMWIESVLNNLDDKGRSGYLSLSQRKDDGSGESIPDVPFFENNTIINNSATLFGGGLYIIGIAPQLMNTIIWGNTAPNNPQIYGTADIQYSDVEGVVYPGTGNISEDPQFVVNNEYCILEATSPCVDAGNPDPMYFDVGAGGNALPPAHGSILNDMGHCGGPASLWYLWDWPMPVEDGTPVLSEYILMQNYPNPFNPNTKIRFTIPSNIKRQMSNVTLKVYDVLGNEVVTLVDEEKPPGEYEVEFSSYSGKVRNLASGVYLYQLEAGDFIETRKMLLLK